MPTFDEAARCPKCGDPGNPVGTKPGPRRSTLTFLQCENERCKWYHNGTYVVQVREDGTIPDARKPGGQKEIAPLSEAQKAFARRTIEDAINQDLRDSQGLGPVKGAE
jgi:hypothetical protein